MRFTVLYQFSAIRYPYTAQVRPSAGNPCGARVLHKVLGTLMTNFYSTSPSFIYLSLYVTQLLIKCQTEVLT